MSSQGGDYLYDGVGEKDKETKARSANIKARGETAAIANEQGAHNEGGQKNLIDTLKKS